ncbi:MAG: NUDIX hydrolase [Acholeplasmatales bacterium]|nr:NUDIX hydrolase [Acholeplasmatales bacterium]
MIPIIKEIIEYNPVNEQEAKDKKLILDYYQNYKEFSFSRESVVSHFSSSCWIVDETMSYVLVHFHNLYQNWGWLGGHADNEFNLLDVAIREAHEESGLVNITPVSDKFISLEVLPVHPHIKHNKFVSAHLHMNVTYLFTASMDDEIRIKPDENSAIKWVPLDEIVELTNEACMKPIYKKLNDYVKKIRSAR